jgi:hypothetical protein
MEIAILAALGIIGYELRGKRTDSNQKYDKESLRLNNQYPFNSQSRLQLVREQEACAVRRNLEKVQLTPGQTDHHSSSKPFHNNMVPFFGSAGSQQSCDKVKTRRLETFTGTDNESHTKKIEQKSLFNPNESRAITTGMPSASDTERFSTFATSTFHTSVNADPSSNQRVGPGVGLGYNTASSGGFHPESVVRILPTNINEYNVNQLDPFETTAGKSQVTSRMKDIENFKVNDVDNFYSQYQYPTMATGGVQKGATSQSEVVLKCNNREKYGQLYENHKGSPVARVMSQHGSIGESYNRKSSQCVVHPGAPSQPSVGNISMGEWDFPEQNRTNQNFACDDANLNISGSSRPGDRGGYHRETTLRQTLSCQNSPAPYHSLSNQPESRRRYELPTTLKDTLTNVERDGGIERAPSGSSYVQPGVASRPGQQLENASTLFALAPSRTGAGTNLGLGNVHINERVFVHDVNPTHCQYANQPIDPRQLHLSKTDDDLSCFRPPVIGRAVFEDRAIFGKVELK